MFTLVNAVLIRGLPFDQPDRLVALGTTDSRGRQLGISRLDSEDWQPGRSLAGLALFLGAPMNISEEALAPEQFQRTYGSASLFGLIGQRPALGRDFRPEDDRPEGEPVVIISHGVWQNRYGGDPDMLGRVIKVNSLPCTVIGVMPPDMRFPFNNDIWVPLSKLPAAARDTTRGVRNFTALGRLGPGVTLEQAQPAARDRRVLSMRSCRTIRQRLAPRETRTAISRERCAARARSRLATLAQAMRSTNATAPMRERNINRICGPVARSL